MPWFEKYFQRRREILCGSLLSAVLFLEPRMSEAPSPYGSHAFFEPALVLFSFMVDFSLTPLVSLWGLAMLYF